MLAAVLCLVPIVCLASPPPPADADDEGFDLRPKGAPAVAAPAGAEAPQLGIPMTMSKTFEAGGILMYPIAACSIVMLGFGIERMVVLRRRRVIPRDFVQRFLAHLERGELDRPAALQLCEDNGSPTAEVFAHGVRKWGKPSVEVEQAIIDGGERQVGQLRKHLRILNAVATVSPLLGLLGTVFGMIKCFNDIANSSAMGKAEQLAGGIGEALITTAGGLTVAIPALLLYMFFAGRIDSLVMEMDELAQKVVNLISAEGLAAQTAGLPRIAAPRPKSLGVAAVKNS
ncbi:MAG: MotA/TolQ/ExbB proton channel family protein [Planctomycetaceae bacterium]|nr:MotA/TolQ/ExbB proton channel family protein [Planctomycetaceae bacterium]